MCDTQYNMSMNTNEVIKKQRQNLILELRRGALVLAVLAQLGEAQYGYSLIQRLGDAGLEIDQGTLYPLLRRLEERGLLTCEWQVEGSRPRKYYVRSEVGDEILESLRAEWKRMGAVMEALI